MHWEKTICIRLTLRRIVGILLATSTMVNLVIVGAAYGAASSPAPPAITPVLTTVTPTNTATLPAPTAKETLISSVTQIPGVSPTNTPGSTPTDTFTPTETSTDVPIPIICVKRFYWPSYLVQAGNSLSFLAAATGTSVNELMVANCLSNNRIFVGQVLYVPRLPATITAILSVTPTATQTPTATATSTATTITPTATYSQTPTPTFTSTNTFTATPTYTSSPPPTATNSPPQVSIRSPSNGAGYPYDDSNKSYPWYTSIELIGSASDIEDDVLSDSSLVWTTDRNDIQDPFLGNGSTLKTTLYSNVCGGEWHTITFTGVDSNGAVATATIKIFIGESQLC
jgi:hypothetical protein